jgi:hypothetical protein
VLLRPRPKINETVAAVLASRSVTPFALPLDNMFPMALRKKAKTETKMRPMAMPRPMRTVF